MRLGGCGGDLTGADRSYSLVLRKSPNTQVVLFSATFASHVRTFAQKFAPGANSIQLKQEELSLDAIKQFFMDCRDSEHKYDILVELYNLLTIGQSIIFVQRRDTADRVAKRMTEEGHKVVSLHGGLQPGERDEVMESFRTGKNKVLIATNVISRGIDVLQVNMVVNYDLPMDERGQPDAETYLHRIGESHSHSMNAGCGADTRPAPRRSHRALWPHGRLDQFRARPQILRDHDGDRQRARETHHFCADGRPGADGVGEWLLCVWHTSCSPSPRRRSRRRSKARHTRCN